MEVNCPFCGQVFDAESPETHSGKASCPACGAVLPLGGDNSDEAAKPYSGTILKFDVPEIKQPKGVAIDESGPDLRLVRRWFNGGAAVAAAALAGMFGYMAHFLAGDPMIQSMTSYLGMSTASNPFTLLLAAACAFFVFATLCILVNRTVIEVGDEALSVRHAPIPIGAAHAIQSNHVAQLFCRRRGRRYNQPGTMRDYDLVVELKDGARISLLRGISEHEQVLYLEQQIEKRLCIKDRRVPGEAVEAYRFQFLRQTAEE